jgi:hypothetical protein
VVALSPAAKQTQFYSLLLVPVLLGRCLGSCRVQVCCQIHKFLERSRVLISGFRYSKPCVRSFTPKQNTDPRPIECTPNESRNHEHAALKFNCKVYRREPDVPTGVPRFIMGGLTTADLAAALFGAEILLTKNLC